MKTGLNRELPAATGSSTTTTTPPGRSIQGLEASGGDLESLPSVRATERLKPATRSRTPTTGSHLGRLDDNRQAVQGPVPAAGRPNGDNIGTAVGAMPNVNQSFGGLFKKKPAARPDAAAVREQDHAVAGQDQGRQERRHHQRDAQVQSVTAEAPTTTPSDPPLAGGRPRIGGRPGRADVDLDVPHGQRRAILGPNGAGKTSPFNLIAGDFPPEAGTIEVPERDVTTLPPRARPSLGLSRSYQKSRLFAGLTVRDNLYLDCSGKRGSRPRWYRGRADAELIDRARHAADQVALADGSTRTSARSRTGRSASSRSRWRRSPTTR